MKSNLERLIECLTCKYWRICKQTVAVPEDYPDGSCKTKDSLKNKTETGISAIGEYRAVSRYMDDLKKEFKKLWKEFSGL